MVLAAFFAGAPGLAAAATYYVDPASGSNSNNGTSPGSPWLNPPGTRTANNTGFWSSTWGGISTGNKIKCGDVILLKGGSTQTSARGGAWIISSAYYTTGCTTGNRISIRIATSSEWAGSTGHFTINASGVTDGDGGLGLLPQDRARAMITIAQVAFVQIMGLSASQRIAVNNADSGGVGFGANSGSLQGTRLDWFDFNNIGDYGVSVGRASNFQVSNVTANLIGASGFYAGWNVDAITDAGAFVNCTAHDSGCGSPASPGCTSHGGRDGIFFFVGGRNLWCVNCTAFNSGDRGVNTGVINDANMGGDFNFKFRNLVAYNNGLTCNIAGNWCSGTGIDTSGNDWRSSDTARNYIVGMIAYGNPTGGEGTYGGGYQEVWNGTFFKNGNGGGGSQHLLRSETKGQHYFNMIDTRQGGGATEFTAGSADSSQPQRQYTPIALNNCFRPSAANSEGLGANASGWPGSGTYASPPAWIGPTNKTGLTNCDPKFVALSATSFASNDFHLQAGSTAIDAGRFLMLANGPNSGNTIQVKGNGGSSDPRVYFIGPASYLDPSPKDMEIQIEGCGVRHVTGMTATTISFDGPSCSWVGDAGVHLPWSGARPDMGAFEYGLSSPGSPAPPTLLSVDPLP